MLAHLKRLFSRLAGFISIIENYWGAALIGWLEWNLISGSPTDRRRETKKLGLNPADMCYMYQQWGNLTLECKICDQLTNSCLWCWNRSLDYSFLHINIFSSGWRRVPPLARWLGTSTPSSWGSSRTARTLSRTLRLSTLMKWAENKNTVSSLQVYL